MDIPTPTITVSFPPALRPRVGGRTKVTTTGRTVREIIDTLEQSFLDYLSILATKQVNYVYM